jgi:hypothetical protein
VIGHTALGANYKSDFGVPYYVVHRAHYHDALHKVAVKLGVTIQLGARVIEYQEKKGTVVLEDGSVVAGDLVVAVDGMIRTAFTLTCLADTSCQASTQLRAAILNQMLLTSLCTMAWLHIEAPLTRTGCARIQILRGCWRNRIRTSGQSFNVSIYMHRSANSVVSVGSGNADKSCLTL